MRSRSIVLILLSLWILLGAPAAAVPAISIDGDLSGAGTGAPIQITVTLTGATNGISGYNISASLEGADVAEITAISFPPWATLHSNGSLPSAHTWASGADLGRSVETGSDTVNLLTLTVTPKASGTASLIITPAKIDDDLGGRYAIPDLDEQLNFGNIVITTNSGGSDDSGEATAATPTTAPTAVATDSPLAADTEAPQEAGTVLRTSPITTVEATSDPLTETQQHAAGVGQSALVACGLAIAGIMLYRRER